MQFIKYIKYKAQYHGNHTGKNHSGKFYISQIQSDSGKAYINTTEVSARFRDFP